MAPAPPKLRHHPLNKVRNKPVKYAWNLENLGTSNLLAGVIGLGISSSSMFLKDCSSCFPSIDIFNLLFTFDVKEKKEYI